MSLKQSVVVVNEFSTPTPKGGSRGKTPGNYVMRYMARKGATEPVTPIRLLNTENFILRYMARNEATEVAHTKQEVHDKTLHVSGLGGVAFGYGQVSLSDTGVRNASADIQRLFDQGHTVMKTVISFDEKYLRDNGVIAKDFKAKRPGDYRGHIDQMRLRMAIMRGLERMGHGFDDLRYVGVIQVDTMHVHCHLAMVDAGKGRTVTINGKTQQRGKLTSEDKSLLRRGIDSSLDQNQQVAHMASAVSFERTNVTSFVKRWAHERVLDDSLPQLLLACLPENKNLWRYGTNRVEMRQANRVATELINDVLDQPGSPMSAAMLSVTAYAQKRASKEGLSSQQRDILIEHGRELIIERCVNSLYQVLKSLPDSYVSTRTKMLDLMGQDFESLLAEQAQQMHSYSGSGKNADDDLLGFSLRLRSYGSRLREHDQARRIWRNRALTWENARMAGAVSPDSYAVYQFYLEEEEYHERCVSKYRGLLGPLAHGVNGRVSAEKDANNWMELMDVVEKRRKVLDGIEALIGDASIARMKDPDEAEKVGRAAHGVSGGRLLVLNRKEGRKALRERAKRAKLSLESGVSDLISALNGQGLVLRAIDDADIEVNSQAGSIVEPKTKFVSDVTGLVVSEGERWSLSQTKGLDMHNVRFDTLVDLEVGPHVAEDFIIWARRRKNLMLNAQRYLDSTNQSYVGQYDWPIKDVLKMNQLADDLEKQMLKLKPGQNLILHSALTDAVPNAQRFRRSATVRLGEGLAQIVRDSAWRETEDVTPVIDEELSDLDVAETREVG